MNSNQLYHIYQAWRQDNEHYERDWSYFVEYAARCLNTTGDKVMKVLQCCHWFKYRIEE